MSAGSLGVVGTGLKLVGHVTLEAQAFIKQADKVFFLVNDMLMARWVQDLNPTAESLSHFYAEGKLRLHTYREMVAHILAPVRQGLRVCAVFYGHPGVAVTPTHEAIRQARREGFRAWMMPGISAEDCLFADLGFDPTTHGCQSFEATEFLLRQRQVDTASNLILWQIGVIGNLYLTGDHAVGLQILSQVLTDYYGPDHEVAVYEATRYATLAPRIERIPLKQLATAEVTRASTLYIPPKQAAEWDQEMMDRLGINMTDLKWE